MRMDEFHADLHCHSTCSDGSLTPVELIRHALECGLQGLSITDHDTTAAYKDAMPFAKEKGLELLPGVEFSAAHQNVSIHILGYAFVPSHPAIIALSNRHVQRRTVRIKEILARLNALGMPISEEDLKKDL